MYLKKTVKNMIKKSMKVDLGDKGLDKSWQKEFGPETKCIRCGGEARIAFVAHEQGKMGKGKHLS